MASWLNNMYVQLGFSPKAAKLLSREQALDSSEGFQVLTDENANVCNVMRKPGGENIDLMPNRGQQVSVIAQESLMLAVFLFHHRWRCTLDWEIMGVNEDTVCLMTGQKKLEDEYKDPNMLQKINKSNMVGMMEAIKEYLRSCQGIVRAPLAYVIRKMLIVQTYGDYPLYATPGDEIIARMLHLPADQNMIYNK